MPGVLFYIILPDEQKYEDYTEPEPETADVSDKVQNELEKLEAIFAQKMKIPATKSKTIIILFSME